jgi:phage tail P2-like protein
MWRTLNIVPESIRSDPQVIAACEAIDNELTFLYEDMPDICFWPFVEKQVPPLLDVLAWEMHVDHWQGWEGNLSNEKKVELINKSIDWHQHKGTKYAVEQMVQTIFTQGYVTEWFEYGGNPFFFKIILKQQVVDAEQLRTLLESVMAVKNVRSWIEAIELTTGRIPQQLFIIIVAGINVTVKIPVSENPRPGLLP